jgi:uncharacterized protein involved in exopolysaccharide biosynthesis
MNQAHPVGIPASLNARDVLGIVLRRLWIVVVIMILALGLSWYVSKRTPRHWKATGKLLLVQRNTAIVTTPQSNVAAPLVETIET